MEHKQNIQDAIDSVSALKGFLNEKLEPLPHLKQRAVSVLDTLIAGFKHTIGQTVDDKSSPADFNPTPITQAFGMDVTKRTQPVTDAKPTDADKEALRDEANRAYENFLERDSKDILDNVEHMVIRAVAVKAGVPNVTSTAPKMTVKFIDNIKQAITDKVKMAEGERTALVAQAEALGVKVEDAMSNEEINNLITEAKNNDVQL